MLVFLEVRPIASSGIWFIDEFIEIILLSILLKLLFYQRGNILSTFLLRGTIVNMLVIKVSRTHLLGV